MEQDPKANPDCNPESDAYHLKQVAEIQSDPKRHEAAVAHLEKEKNTVVDAHKQSRKNLEKLTKERLKKTFQGDKKFKDQPSQDKEEATAKSAKAQTGVDEYTSPASVGVAGE
jgi:hypothetical protein